MMHFASKPDVRHRDVRTFDNRYGPRTPMIDQTLGQARSATLAQVLRVYHLYQQPDPWQRNVARRHIQRAIFSHNRGNAWQSLDAEGYNALVEALPSPSLILKTAWAGVADALRDALEALTVTDKVDLEHFQIMYQPWGDVFDPHGEVAKLI